METNGLYNTRLHAPHDSAHSQDGSARVKELEEEVGMLTEKVMESAGRFANYENEIRRLNIILNQRRVRNASDDGFVDTNTNTSHLPPPIQKPGISRFGSFMYSRKLANTEPANATAGAQTVREKELEAALAKEQALRQAAEKKAAEVNGEIEELSASLFQQANEMVATERKESAKLRERVRIVEQRDSDRKRRLDKLEAAQRRIERARALLVPR